LQMRLWKKNKICPKSAGRYINIPKEFTFK
jgi:hypothetical protein